MFHHRYLPFILLFCTSSECQLAIMGLMGSKADGYWLCSCKRTMADGERVLDDVMVRSSVLEVWIRQIFTIVLKTIKVDSRAV